MTEKLFSQRKIQLLALILVSLTLLGLCKSQTEFLQEKQVENSNLILTGNNNYNDDSPNYNQDWVIDYPIYLNINLSNLNFTPRIRFMLRDGSDVTNFFSVSFSNTQYNVQIPESPYLKEFLVYFYNSNPQQNLISKCSLNGQLITNTKQEDEWQERTNKHTENFNWYNNSTRGRVKSFVYAGYIRVTDNARWENIGILSNTLSYDNFRDD